MVNTLVALQKGPPTNPWSLWPSHPPYTRKGTLQRRLCIWTWRWREGIWDYPNGPTLIPWVFRARTFPSRGLSERERDVTVSPCCLWTPNSCYLLPLPALPSTLIPASPEAPTSSTKIMLRPSSFKSEKKETNTRNTQNLRNENKNKNKTSWSENWKYAEACFLLWRILKVSIKRNQRPPFLFWPCHLLGGVILVNPSISFFYKPTLIMLSCSPHLTGQE